MAEGGRLYGRPAIVTGGASGIGAATARRFAAEGANVLIADIRDGAGEELVREIEPMRGRQLEHPPHGRHRPERRPANGGRRRAVLGGVAVLFNNAMADPRDDYGDDQRWNMMLESGLAAYWAASIEAALLLERSGVGRAIVSNASIAGAKIAIEFASEAYSAAKGGVVLLDAEVVQRLGPRGIRVNCVCPGIIETPRWRSPGEPELASRAAGGRWLRSDASDARRKSPTSFSFSRATRRRSSAVRTSRSTVVSRPPAVS